ncbi:MAG: hypothetical protein M0P76_05930 [Candidatus Pacebacteria bacterium]|nr:hypothetical protein [Candidatus Paceibacterota bacterium]
MKTQKQLAKIKNEWKSCRREEELKRWSHMSHSQIKGYLEEFGGWLQYWTRTVAWSPYSIDRYYTSRLEPEILEHKPERVRISWSPFKPEWEKWDTEKIILIGKTTFKVLGVHYEGEMVDYLKTVGETIDGYPNKEEITHIFSYWKHTNAAIIYKSPQGISVPDWIEKLVAKEKAKIHAEVEAIDAEYTAQELPLSPSSNLEDSPLWIKYPEDGVHYDDGHYRIIDPRFCKWLHQEPIRHEPEPEIK